MRRDRGRSTASGIRSRGVALPIALILAMLLSSLLVEAIGTVSGETLIAANQQAFQRAFESAQGGIAWGLRRLPSMPPAASPQVITRSPAGDNDAGSRTTLTATARVPFAPGFSTGLFSVQHFELRSIGDAGRASATVVQGALRIEAQHGEYFASRP